MQRILIDIPDVSTSTRYEILDKHNELRAGVSPSAANMLQMVSVLPQHGCRSSCMIYIDMSLIQYPKRRFIVEDSVKARSREFGGLNYYIALKFDKRFGSSATEKLTKLQNYWNIYMNAQLCDFAASYDKGFFLDLNRGYAVNRTQNPLVIAQASFTNKNCLNRHQH